MTGGAVPAGTPATLACSLTELESEVTISWYLGEDGPLTDTEDGEYSARK